MNKLVRKYVVCQRQSVLWRTRYLGKQEWGWQRQADGHLREWCYRQRKEDLLGFYSEMDSLLKSFVEKRDKARFMF